MSPVSSHWVSHRITRADHRHHRPTEGAGGLRALGRSMEVRRSIELRWLAAGERGTSEKDARLRCSGDNAWCAASRVRGDRCARGDIDSGELSDRGVPAPL